MRSQCYRIQIHDPKVATVCLHLAFHWPLGDSSNKLAVLGSVDLVKSLARSLLRCVRFNVMESAECLMLTYRRTREQRRITQANSSCSW